MVILATYRRLSASPAHCWVGQELESGRPESPPLRRADGSARPDADQVIALAVNAVLAALIQGQTGRIDDLLRDFRITASTLPGQIAIYSAGLAAAGHLESARKVLASLDPSSLLPEERAWYDQAWNE